MKYILLAFMISLQTQITHALEVSGALTQGGHAFARVEKGSRVEFNDKAIDISPSGWFGVGFHRNHPPEAMLKITTPNGKTTTHTFLITPRDYPVQHIKGVPQKTVTPNTKQNTTAAEDSRKIKAARAQNSAHQHFLTQFTQPSIGRESGVYGSRRTYNGTEKSWHKGLDLAAPTGTPIYAPAGGTITFADHTFYNGNLLVLDHGNRFFTIYAHLNSMDVKVGDTITARQKIGEVGTTGRSTGPHLHWGYYWGQTALDPKLLLRK